MFAILLLALAANDVTPVIPTVYCEAMEINSYGPSGIEQLLLMEWDNRIGEYAVRQWKICQSESLIRDMSIDKDGYYTLYFRTEDCFIKSKYLYWTYTELDKELEQRKKYNIFEIGRDRGITPQAKKSWINRYMSTYWLEKHDPKSYRLRLVKQDGDNE